MEGQVIMNTFSFENLYKMSQKVRRLKATVP